jgi:iron complex transport system ATP-binding protein
MALKIKQLTIGYQAKKQLLFATDLPDLSFAEGELIAVVGANGCGKSTFLKTLLNLMQPIKGQISWQEQVIQDYSFNDWAKIQSVVLTDTLPPSNFSCTEIVALGRLPYTAWHGLIDSADHAIVTEVLAEMDLLHLKDKLHHELSDGQLQRTMIGRALVQNTPLMIFDEPTTYLDLAHQFKLIRLLKDLTHQKNKCIIFSTHAIELAIEHADYILAFTARGNFYGSPKELIANKTINKLFENDGLLFDDTLNKFVFKPI